MRLIKELQRRNVFRVAALYVVGGWLILQIGDLLFDLMGLPDFALRIVLGILVLGLPVALVMAWIYELTPEGVKRESEVDRTASVTGDTGRKLNIAVIAAVVLALGAMGLQQLLPDVAPGPDLAAGEVEKGSGSFSAEIEPDPISDARISIAVLPFADLSPEGDQEYFADGISEEILNLLASVPELKVASRTSSFAFKGMNRTIVSIADELGVDHVLEGSVRKAGDRLRITAQLIQAESDEHLWSDTYDRTLDDVFAIQDELASSILEALSDALGLALDPDLIEVPEIPADLSAYALFLEGRELFVRRTEFDRAMEMLEQAVAVDPNFARAWAQLGAVYTVVESWGLTGRPYQSLARQAAERALALDPELALAHAVQGNVASVNNDDPDWAEAFRHFDRALELEPRNTTAIFWRGVNWLQLGFFETARADMERCLEVDPAYQNCAKRLALLDLLAGDDAGALARFVAAEEAGNESLTFRFVPAMVRSGNRIGALTLLRRAAETSGVGNCPYSDIIDLLAGLDVAPDRVAGALACADAITVDAVALATGHFDRIRRFAYGGVLWQPEFPAFMQSDDFDRIARDLNVFDFWREHGPPPQCRQVGDEFECRMP